jgi:hypothetical protein
MSWSEEGILFGQPEGIMMVPAEGGPSRLIAKAEGDEFLFGPEMLPGGRAIMFTVGNGQSPDLWDRASIVVQSLADGRRTRVIDGGSDARYLPTGHLVYALGGTVYGVQFDLEQLKTVGTPVPVLEGVMRSFAGATGAAQYGVSNNGALVYVPGPPGASPSQFELVMTDRKGAIQPVGLPPGQYLFPRVSPGGGSIAYQADDGKETSIWVHDLKSGRAQRRLTFGGTNRFPIWSPDGQRVAFQSDRGGDRGIFVQRADGTGAAERLTKADGGAAHIPSSWSPAGTHLLFDEQKGPDFVLRVLSLRDRTTASFGDVVSKSLTTGVFSPDGKRVAYSIAPVGPNDPTIMVQPFPATGDRSQIYSQTGDNPHHPQWSQDGTQLFFVPRVGGFEAVDIVTTPTFAFGNPVPVPRAFPLAPPTAPRTYDLTADGRVLSAASPSGVPGRNMQPIHVVLSWFSELTGRVPAR